MSSHSSVAAPLCTPEIRLTRSLLGYGVLAGPLYVAVSLGQALTRPGFDRSRHAWSLLENGDLGWLQVTNFIVSGLMTVAAVVGLRRAGSGRWVPRLIGGYGAALVGAGLFHADPALGFPLGTPEVTTVSWHGMLHRMVGALGCACLIAAALVLGRRFARAARRGLAWFSRIAGVGLFLGFAGIASGSHGPTTLAFVAAVVTVSAWLSVVSVHVYRTAR